MEESSGNYQEIEDLVLSTVYDLLTNEKSEWPVFNQSDTGTDCSLMPRGRARDRFHLGTDAALQP